MNQDLLNRNYHILKQSGKIKATSNAYVFIKLLEQELKALKQAVDICKEFNGSNDQMFQDITERLTEMFLTCYGMSSHFGMRIKQEMIKKIETNEKLADDPDQANDSND